MTDYYYIHIPFCRQRCPYCKFALTPVFDEFKKRRYIEYLKKEIREYFVPVIAKNYQVQVSENTEHRLLRASQGRKQETIYFGGGTPSVLSHDEIFEILECFPFWTSPPFRGSQRGYPESTPPSLLLRYNSSPKSGKLETYKGRNPEVENLEITMEMNPEDVTSEYIKGVLALGINRISLGIQTLNETSLKEIHRSDRNTIFCALESISSEIKKSNNNISLNIDFILGLPFVKSGETLAGIQELHTRFPYITHTSVYMLEDESYPRHWRKNSITEDEMQSEFLEIMEYFISIGWHHYELSNFAKPGYESEHNQSYWDHSNSRGFGLSAASYENRKRWSNSSSFNGYYGGKRDNEEKLTPEQKETEEMMFGLRRNGWDAQTSFVKEVPKYEAEDFVPDQGKQEIPPSPLYKGGGKLDTLIADGLLEIHENRIKPTKTGIFVIDHILSELI